MAAAHEDIVKVVSELGNHPVEMSDNATYAGKAMDSLDDVRYEIFSKKGHCSEKLPPTMDAACLHIRRANYQAFIWNSAHEQYQQLPTPLQAGWNLNENGQIVPELMTQPAAPEALLDFVKCGCRTECSNMRCKCRKDSVLCTDACGCDNEMCVNRCVDDTSDSDSDVDRSE